MIQFKENARTDGRTEGRKDGQTLFYGTLPDTARDPIILVLLYNMIYNVNHFDHT